MEITKEEAVKWILEQDEETIKRIYNIHSNKITKVKKKSNLNLSERKINKDTDKYQILLKYVNGILENIGENKINELVKFMNIDRDKIIKDENNKLLYSMEKELFNHYSKFHSGYYRKSSNKSLNCLRGMCKEIGLLLVSEKKDVCEKINGKSYRRTKYFYTIKSE